MGVDCSHARVNSGGGLGIMTGSGGDVLFESDRAVYSPTVPFPRRQEFGSPTLGACVPRGRYGIVLVFTTLSARDCAHVT